jgi:hypothetical protein
LYCVFQAPLSLWDFFQLSSTCPIHLKIGTCSLNIIELSVKSSKESTEPVSLLKTGNKVVEVG